MDNAIETSENTGLMMTIVKCKLVSQEAEFLGQITTLERFRPTQKHIDKILSISKPTNLKQLRCLLGKFYYHVKLIKSHAAIMAPQSELTKGHSEHSKIISKTS